MLLSMYDEQQRMIRKEIYDLPLLSEVFRVIRLLLWCHVLDDRRRLIIMYNARINIGNTSSSRWMDGWMDRWPTDKRAKELSLADKER